MARPPLAMGTHGSISITKRPGSSAYVARCRFRDFDGVTRSLERSRAVEGRGDGRIAGRGSAPAGDAGRAATAAPHVRAGGRGLAGQARRPGGRGPTRGDDRGHLPPAALVGGPAGDGAVAAAGVHRAAAGRVLHRFRVRLRDRSQQDGPDGRARSSCGSPCSTRRSPTTPCGTSTHRGGCAKPRALTAQERRQFLAWMQGPRRTRRRRGLRRARAGVISRTS